MCASASCLACLGFQNDGRDTLLDDDTGVPERAGAAARRVAEVPVQDARDREQFTHDAVVTPVHIESSLFVKRFFGLLSTSMRSCDESAW
jgi:hypothetical protein